MVTDSMSLAVAPFTGPRVIFSWLVWQRPGPPAPGIVEPWSDWAAEPVAFVEALAEGECAPVGWPQAVSNSVANTSAALRAPQKLARTPSSAISEPRLVKTAADFSLGRLAGWIVQCRLRRIARVQVNLPPVHALDQRWDRGAGGRVIPPLL